MTNAKVLVVVCLLQVCVSTANAQLFGEFPEEGGAISLTTTDGPIDSLALNFTAIEGTINFGTDPSPFQFFIGGQDAKAGADVRDVIMGNLGVTSTLDGTVTLDLRASPGAVVHGLWAESVVTHFFPINGEMPPPIPTIEGSFPFGGGPVTVRSGPNSDSLGRIAISADNGSLVSSGNPAPFNIVTASRADYWEIEATPEVTLDGTLTLDLIASANASLYGTATNSFGETQIQITQDRSMLVSTIALLHSSFPNGGGPISIEPWSAPVSLTALSVWTKTPNETPLSSPSGNPAPFSNFTENSPGVWSVRSDSSVIIDGRITLDVHSSVPLEGLVVQDGDIRSSLYVGEARTPGQSVYLSFPERGGPLKLSHKTREPVSLQQLTINASEGELTSSGSAAPFETLNLNAPETWSVSSEAGVMLDGEVTLDVFASAYAQLDASVVANDIEWTIPVSSKPALDVDDLADVISRAPWYGPLEERGDLMALVPSGGGPIIILAGNEPIQSEELSFQASSPILSVASDASPFETITTGEYKTSSFQVTLSSQGMAETITSQPTILNVFAESHEGIVVTWGDGRQVNAQPLIQSRPLPEPSSNGMMWTVILALGCVRRSRTSRR